MALAVAVGASMLAAHTPAQPHAHSIRRSPHAPPSRPRSPTVAPCADAVGFIYHDSCQQPPPVQRPAAADAAANVPQGGGPGEQAGTSGIESLPIQLHILPIACIGQCCNSPQRLLQPLPLDQLLGSDIQQLDGGALLAKLQKHGLQGEGDRQAGHRQWQRQQCVRHSTAAAGRCISCQRCQHAQGFQAASPSQPSTPAPTHPPTHPPTRDSVTVCWELR